MPVEHSTRGRLGRMAEGKVNLGNIGRSLYRKKTTTQGGEVSGLGGELKVTSGNRDRIPNS